MPCLNAQLGISYSDKSSLASLDVEKDKYKLAYDYKSQVSGCWRACLNGLQCIQYCNQGSEPGLDPKIWGGTICWQHAISNTAEEQLACVHCLHTRRRLTCLPSHAAATVLNRTWHSSSPTRAMWGLSRSGSMCPA
jgi:hypothetical protein